MTTVQTILTGLAVMAAALYAERGPDPYSGFGPVVCMVEPDVPPDPSGVPGPGKVDAAFLLRARPLDRTNGR